MLSNDLEQRMQEKLLEGLIEHMHDRMGDRLSPAKPMGVTVEAESPEHLAEGLDQAKDVVASGKLPSDDHSDVEPDSDHGSESDEDRLLELLSDEEDEEKNR